MDYNRIYNNLIQHRREQRAEGYTERHHIVPRCMGGTNHKSNLVRLTAREHFIAHLLLLKIHPAVPGLIYAVNMMTRKFTDERANNRMYDWLKRRYSEVNRGRIGTMIGKKHTPESLMKMKAAAQSRAPRQSVGTRRKSSLTTEQRSEIGKRAANTRKAQSPVWHSENTVAKIKKGRQVTSEKARKSSRERRLGQKASEDTKRKQSESHKGQIPWNKGKAWSEEERKKRSESVKRTKALKKAQLLAE